MTVDISDHQHNLAKQHITLITFSHLPIVFFYMGAPREYSPDGIGATVKRTADILVLHGNDMTNGKEFFEKISNCLSGVQLYHTEEEDMEKYYTLLIQQLKQVPSTRKIHQVIPHQNSVSHRQLSCFCSEPMNYQCFTPATFLLNDCADEQQTETRAKKKGPLVMLMEEMEKLDGRRTRLDGVGNRGAASERS